MSIAKLGRLFRIGRLIKKLDQFTAARAVRVVNLLIVLLLCTHFMACFWWKIGMDTPDDLGWPLRTEVAAVLLEVDVSPASDDPFLYYVDDSTAMLNLTHLRQRIEDDVDIPKKYITSLYCAPRRSRLLPGTWNSRARARMRRDWTAVPARCGAGAHGRARDRWACTHPALTPACCDAPAACDARQGR